MDAAVRDGERSVREVVGRQRAVARARSTRSAIRSVDLLEREPVGAARRPARRARPRVSTATATLISSSSSIVVSVTRALRIGCSRSAAATSFTTIAVTPIRGCAPAVVELRPQLDERLDVELEHRRQLRGALQARDHAGRDRPAAAAQRDLARDRQRRPRPAGAPDRASAQAATSRSTIRPPGPEPVISRASSSV